MSRLLKLRSAPTLNANRALKIDRDNLVIHDVVAMQAGIEALGHGCQADARTLEMTRDLGNAHRYGVRSRFGHPGMSENAAGKKIGVGRNFHVAGDKLLHDMHLLDAARGSPVFARDPVDFIFDMAERYPEEFGESVVIEAQFVWTLADGREIPEWDPWGDNADDVEWDENHRPVNALTPLPVIRPDKFYYVDVVNEGALTHDGLFGAEVAAMMFSGTSNLYAQEVFDLLDRFRDEYNIPLEALPGKVDQVMSRYLFTRGYKEPTMAATKKSLEEKLNTGGTITASSPLGTSYTTTDVPTDEALIEAAAESPLESALATARQTQQRQQEPAETLAAEPPVSLEARIEALEELARDQQATIAGLIELSALNTQNIQTCDENIRQLAAEPVVKMSVPKTSGAMAGLQALGGSLSLSIGGRPTPPREALKAVIQHQDPRPGQAQQVDFDADPEAATLAAHLGRQKVSSQ